MKRRIVLDETAGLQDQIATALSERLTELGRTLAGTARAMKMDGKTLHRSIYGSRPQGMSLLVLERVCKELNLEVKLVPKRSN